MSHSQPNSKKWGSCGSASSLPHIPKIEKNKKKSNSCVPATGEQSVKTEGPAPARPKTPQDPTNEPLSIDDIYTGIKYVSDDESDNSEVQKVTDSIPWTPQPPTPEHRPFTPLDPSVVDKLLQNNN